MSVLEMVKWHGYPAMQYRVTTVDGYILSLNRIPGKKGTKVTENLKLMKTKAKKPVLFIHGFFSNAQSWIISGPDGDGKAIPYQLVDTGDYDVWMMNARGTSPSREHMFLSANTDDDFWNFSFEEKGQYDLKACVAFIQSQMNSKDKVSLVASSEGVASSFFAFAEDKDFYESMVSMLVALGPTVQLAHS